jgi:hypothetical protein
VGAVVLARRRGGIEGDDAHVITPLDLARVPPGLGSIAEAVGDLPRTARTREPDPATPAPALPASATTTGSDRD